jgi:hypothetical protein
MNQNDPHIAILQDYGFRRGLMDLWVLENDGREITADIHVSGVYLRDAIRFHHDGVMCCQETNNAREYLSRIVHFQVY